MKIFLHFIVSVIMFSCTMKKPETVSRFNTLVSDTSITHRPNDELNFSITQSKKLNLPIIIKGVDSFELRIWSFGMWTRSDLFIFRYSLNKWVAANYIYYRNGDIIDSLHLITRQITNDTASQIRDYLISDSIINLPSQIAIPNFSDNTADGETYYIEVATDKFYKQLCYRNPNNFNDPDNRRFTRLLNFITSHFRFFYPY